MKMLTPEFKGRYCCKIIAVGLVLLCSACAGLQQGRRFATPDAALKALAQAAEAKDKQALKELFGDMGGDILSSGDPVADDAALQLFAKKFAERHELEQRNEEEVVLSIGKEEWPFDTRTTTALRYGLSHPWP